MKPSCLVLILPFWIATVSASENIATTAPAAKKARGAERVGDRRAPVDDSNRADQKKNHALPDAVVERGALDWTMMKAWDNGGSNLSQTGYRINPAGKSIRLAGRVLGIALAQGGRFLLAKTDTHVAVVDADEFTVVKQYRYPRERPRKEERGSMHGLAVGANGSTVAFTANSGKLYLASLDARGELTMGPPILMSANGRPDDPLGVELSPDGKLALVACSVANELDVVDVTSRKVLTRIPVGVCPYGIVLTRDGKTALVSNFGGSQARKGDMTEKSAGTDVALDDRGVALRGTVSVIDMASSKVVAEIVTLIHPEAIALSPDDKYAYVVDGSGDGISVIDVARRAVVGHLDTKPQGDLPYGSLTDGLAVSPDGKTLYAANAGNNAIALIDLQRPGDSPCSFIAAGGFPGSVCLRGTDLFVGNVLGSESGLQRIAFPITAEERARMTQVAQEGFHLAEIIRAQAQMQSGIPPRPVPARPGEPSTHKHVVYVIKENKKYDQVFGDIGRGNSEPRLCEFPRETTPNHHAIADQFVLLDNYYCSGVCSADGHQWAVQGLTSPYREKDWSNGRGTYDFGIDPLCYAGCGFIWDHLLRRGVSFRNFGELDYPVKTTNSSWIDYYRSWKDKTGNAQFKCVYKIETLRRYSDLRFPGWEMDIPDQLRADVFLQALAEFEQAGRMPEFVILYLPDDHTQGSTRNAPTPRAYVADNDLALGRVLEGLSKSRFWNDMVVFVNEDDPQSGADHVDGHRSICLIAGPYVKRRGTVISRFYNQSSVLHTICRIFGAPPMNQLVAMAPVMDDCFQDKPDLTRYACAPAMIALDEMNEDPAKVKSKVQAALAPLTEKLDFSRPDRLGRDGELFSRFEWATVRGDERFPVEYAGMHGKGLKPLGLRLAPGVDDDHDDE